MTIVTILLPRPILTIQVLLTLLVPASFTSPQVLYNSLPNPKANLAKEITLPKEVSFEAFELHPYNFKPTGTYPNAFPVGQCTWGAASMKGNIPWSGNANQWDDNARAMGYTVSDVPIVGSVAVDNSGYYGHVAVVKAVSGGSVTVEETNYDWNGGIRTYTYPTSRFVYIYI